MLADGTTPGTPVRRLVAAGVDAIGVNCGVGPSRASRRSSELGPPGPGEPARSIMPNAGLPQRIEGRFVYAAGPAYFGSIVPRMLDAGAAIVGGCCGTTPDHVAAMRRRARRGHDRGGAAGRRPGGGAGRRRPAAGAASRPRRAPPWPTSRASTAGGEHRTDAPRAALAEGRFVISVEIDPPRARPHRPDARRGPAPPGGRGDVVNVSDTAMARVRMGCDGRRLRHPARPRPRVPRPLHDPRPEPHGARVGAPRRARARRPQHPRPDRRPAAGRRLPDRDGRLGRRLDRPHRDPRPAQPGRGPGGLADRPAGLVHDRVRPRPDRRRRDDRVGPPRAQARRRGPPRHDPAALRRRPGARRCSPRAGAASAPAGSRCRCSSASCRWSRRAPRRVPPQRGPGHHDPRRDAGAHGRRRGRGSEVGIEMARRAARRRARTRSPGTYLMPSFGRYEQAAELVRRIRARHPVAVVATRP